MGRAPEPLRPPSFTRTSSGPSVSSRSRSTICPGAVSCVALVFIGLSFFVRVFTPWLSPGHWPVRDSSAAVTPTFVQGTLAVAGASPTRTFTEGAKV